MNFKKEIGVGVFFLVLAILYFAGSLSISTFDPFASGREGFVLDSRSVPQMLGLMVAVLSIIHIVSNVLKMRKAESQTGNAAQATEKMGFKFDRPRRIMAINVALMLLYLFCFTRLGFILSTFLFIAVEIFLLIPAERRKRWAVFAVCFSLAMSVSLYLLFTKVLSMFLPRGLIG